MALNKNKVIAAAQRYVQKGQIDRAIKEYRSIVDEDPDDVRIWLKIGDLYAKKPSVSQAVATYKKVATYYNDKGFFLKAVAVYKQILNTDPGNVDAHNSLGQLYSHLGLVPDAIAQLQVVVGSHEREGRYRDSLDLLKRIVELAPEDEPNRIRLAEAYARQQEIPSAVIEFKQVLEQLYAKQRLDEFIQVAERLLYLSPDELETVRLLSEVYLRRGDAKRALARLQLLFRANPTDVDTLQLLGTAFSEIGQRAKAISVYRELARIAGESGNEAARLDAYRRLLSLDSQDQEALEATGSSRAAEKLLLSTTSAPLLASAAGSLEESLDPQERLAKYLKDIDIYLKYQLKEHALERLNRVFEIDPESRDAWLRKRAIAREMNRVDDEINALLTLAQIDEHEPELAMSHLGEVLQLAPGHVMATQRLSTLSYGVARQLSVAPGPSLISDSGDEFDMDAVGFDDGLDDAPVEFGLGGPVEDDDAFSDLLDEDELVADDDELADLLDEAPAEDDELADLLDEASEGDDELGDLLDAPRTSREFSPSRASLTSLPDDDLGDLLAPKPAAPEPTARRGVDDDLGDLLAAPKPTARRGVDDDLGDLLAAPKPTARRRVDEDLGDLLSAPKPTAQRGVDDDLGDLLSPPDELSPPESSLLSELGPPELLVDPDEEIADDDEFADLLSGERPLPRFESSGALAWDDELAAPEVEVPVEGEVLESQLGSPHEVELAVDGDGFDVLLREPLDDLLSDQPSVLPDESDEFFQDDATRLGESLVSPSPVAPLPLFEPSSDEEPWSWELAEEEDPFAQAESEPFAASEFADKWPALEPEPPASATGEERDASAGSLENELDELLGARSHEVPEAAQVSVPGLAAEGEDELDVALSNSNSEDELDDALDLVDDEFLPHGAPVVRWDDEAAFEPEPAQTAALETAKAVESDPFERLEARLASESIRPPCQEVAGIKSRPVSQETDELGLPSLVRGLFDDAAEEIDGIDEIEVLEDDDIIELADGDDDVPELVARFDLDEEEFGGLAVDNEPIIVEDTDDFFGAMSVPKVPEVAPLGEELAELDFYLQSGLASDARELMAELAEVHPDHPELLQRARTLSELESQSNEAEDAISALEVPDQPAGHGAVQGAQLSELGDDDAATHFDLGVAFREMGQIKKALEQLTKAAKSPERRGEALRVIALCHMDRGEPADAVAALTDALRLPSHSDARIGLFYDRASAYEALGDHAASLRDLKMIVAAGGGSFLDVQARITRFGG